MNEKNQLTKYFEEKTDDEFQVDTPIDEQLNEWLKSYKGKAVKPVLVRRPEILKQAIYKQETKTTEVFNTCTIQYMELNDIEINMMFGGRGPMAQA